MYPVEYAYDTQGRVKTMTTWQGFAASTGAAVTTWSYHTNRGWLLSKRYNDSKGPDYTYTAGGRLQSRQWWRTVSGSTRLTTTNTYNTAGDLLTVSYNDGVTLSQTNTFDRRGRIRSTSRSDVTTRQPSCRAAAFGILDFMDAPKLPYPLPVRQAPI